MKDDSALSFILTGVSGIMTATQTDAIFQYIQLGITIVSGIVALIYTIWKWHRKATEDGKITKEEVDELLDDVKGTLDDIKKE